MELMNTMIQFKTLENLRTGNPILDMALSGIVLSLITYFITNFNTYSQSIKDFFSSLFVRKHVGELTFKGEELVSTWGNVTRNYPKSYRALLHYIDTHECKEVTSYTEIRSSFDRWDDDDDISKRDKKSLGVVYKPDVAHAFKLTPDIYCEVSRLEAEADGGDKKSSKPQLKTTTLRLYSDALSPADLKEFVSEAITTYDNHVKEEIDKNQYYFVTKMEKAEEEQRLTYDQYEFRTNRSFDNIFFTQKKELLRRIDFFQDNKEWYRRRGVPYTLGFMFYGPPGTGKTSTIKAIASYTKRHIVEVSLGRIKTYRDLQRVFHENTYVDKNIPHHKIIYILEDIDCLDDIVKSRDGDAPIGKEGKGKGKIAKKEEADSDEEGEKDEVAEKVSEELDKKSKVEYQMFKEYQKMWNKDPLTLSHILNILDGLLETPGRILIITTNHPEKLDTALIRPGRVDMKIEFGFSTTEDTVNLLEMFYEKPFPSFERAYIENNKFTPAEIYNICFQEVDMDAAIARLKRAGSGNPLSQSMPMPRVKKE